MDDRGIVHHLIWLNSIDGGSNKHIHMTTTNGKQLKGNYHCVHVNTVSMSCSKGDP